ncbi:Sir2 family NAD-dependent protein deacetylase [Corynebacterium cystitidis]|uniref:Sir2 family NAD-dependent protein deacetylase n=1 Tax=Corynebacterium cystitidis TaxID=35757 RepID=UPI00211F0B16|nr:Sir2 family NAD-dependent protein deacetylase [Corynebacterium cystitidis]
MVARNDGAGCGGARFDDPEVQRVHASAIRSIQRVVEETAQPTDPEKALAGVVGMLRAGPVVVLTGAGVSTDSGVPDYRSPGGRLSTGRPMTYQEFAHSPQALHRYWARAYIGVAHMRAVAPNRNHYALVELERAGLVGGIITQNVDGLHGCAGTQRLVELHGDMDHVVCLDCGYREPRGQFDQRLEAANPGYRESVDVSQHQINPDGDIELDDEITARFTTITCDNCGSPRLKPDVVYFGEAVPRARRQASQALVDASTGLLVVGSSLAVMSGYRVVLEAQKRGLPVAVINGGPGRADHRVEILWRTRIAPALDAVLDACDL